MALSSHLDFGEGRELKSYEFEKLTVSNAVKIFTAAKTTVSGYNAAIRAVVTVETNSIRFRLDGGDPSATDGHLVVAGGSITVEGITNINDFKMIRQSADATVQITYERYTND